jgi:hypothetical protein
MAFKIWNGKAEGVDFAPYSMVLQLDMIHAFHTKERVEELKQRLLQNMVGDMWHESYDITYLMIGFLEFHASFDTVTFIPHAKRQRSLSLRTFHTKRKK